METASFLRNRYWVLRHGKSIPNERGLIVSSLELKENNIPLENVRICYSPFARTSHIARVVVSVLNLPFEGPQCKVFVTAHLPVSHGELAIPCKSSKQYYIQLSNNKDPVTMTWHPEFKQSKYHPFCCSTRSLPWKLGNSERLSDCSCQEDKTPKI